MKIQLLIMYKKDEKDLFTSYGNKPVEEVLEKLQELKKETIYVVSSRRKENEEK